MKILDARKYKNGWYGKYIHFFKMFSAVVIVFQVAQDSYSFFRKTKIL